MRATRKAGVKGDKIEVAGIAVSHPNRVVFPESGITKLELARYYEKIAPRLLPHIAGRPISLLRCPAGEGKTCFFQRHGGQGMSPYIRELKVAGHGADKNGKEQPYIVVDDVKGLLALVQMGVLEIHVWGAVPDNPAYPDRLVFDLDPAPDVPWDHVQKAALEIRANLKKLKLRSFLKTTGGKGLHVVVPFKKGPSWDKAKGFAKAFSEAMVKTAPDSFTINSRKNVRGGKIFIDYLRNSQTASAVAPYSTRARDGAPVSEPIEWNELAGLKSGNSFTMDAVLKRSRKDPWKDIARINQQLPV